MQNIIIIIIKYITPSNVSLMLFYSHPSCSLDTICIRIFRSFIQATKWMILTAQSDNKDVNSFPRNIQPFIHVIGYQIRNQRAKIPPR